MSAAVWIQSHASSTAVGQLFFNSRLVDYVLLRVASNTVLGILLYVDGNLHQHGNLATAGRGLRVFQVKKSEQVQD